jgi:hypothetical protein
MTIYWTVFFILMVLGFAGGEAWAIWKGKQTLSRYVWDVSCDWPPLPWVVGVLTGAVATHFWWHWCPAGSISIGLLQ